MKKVLVLGAMLVGACVGQTLADRDGDFREAVRLAVATGSTVLAEGKIIVGGSDNVAAHKTPSGAWTIDTNGVTTLSGNIPLARMTNAAGTLGGSLGGNIPVAAITNAAGSLGASIGGNIPLAALTNAAGGGLCVVTNVDLNGTTNIITFVGTVQRNQ